MNQLKVDTASWTRKTKLRKEWKKKNSKKAIPSKREAKHKIEPKPKKKCSWNQIELSVTPFSFCKLLFIRISLGFYVIHRLGASWKRTGECLCVYVLVLFGWTSRRALLLITVKCSCAIVDEKRNVQHHWRA